MHEFWRLWERIGRPDRQLEQLEATINRLDQFLASEFVAQLVGSTENTIPFTEVLAGNGRALLLNLPVGEIGEGLTNLLGSLFLAVLTERIFARSRLAPGSRPRVHLYLDEYGRYATPTTAQLLTEGRKFGIGTTIAHQTRAQIPDEENRAAELQVGTLICFQLIGADAQELSGEFRVAPDPQWEERVEEVEGTEPVLAVSQKPVDHLLQHTHQSPGVRAVTQQLLVPIQRMANDDVDYGEKTKSGLELIDRLLVDVMEERVPTTAEGLTDRLTEIVLTLRKFSGMQISRFGYYPDELRDPVREFVVRCLPQEGSLMHILMRRPEYDPILFRSEFGNPLSPELTKLRDALIKCWEKGVEENENHKEGLRYAYQPGRSPLRSGGPSIEERAKTQIQDEGARARETTEEAILSVGKQIGQLAFLCRELAASPIMVPSGQEKPRVRVRYITHPQRSYQDVQNELAVQLANLPRFTAYASIQGEQHQLRLNPPAQGTIDEARIERIRQKSKTRFGRPPEEPPAPPAAPEEPPEEPTGPGITRGYRREG